MEKNESILPELRGKMTDKRLQKATEKENEMELWSRLQRFLEVVNGAIPQEKLVEHPIVKGVHYLPISHMEMALDELFFGEWSTHDFKWNMISNEIVASIELTVTHPITKKEITRTGANAIQIMVDAIPDNLKRDMTKQEMNQWAIDITRKKPGALSNGGFSKLKAECFKNACLSIGKYFGRDVNREFTADDYIGTIQHPDAAKDKLRRIISDILRENQDIEFVQQIATECNTAEQEGADTIEFYKSIIKKITPDGATNN